MATFNRVVILGILGHSPQLKQSRNNRPYCRLSLATHSWRKEGGSSTNWHSVHVFGKEAESAAQHLQKGRSVLVEGRIESMRFVDVEGKNVWKTWIHADHLTFVNNPPGENEMESSSRFEEEHFGGAA